MSTCQEWMHSTIVRTIFSFAAAVALHLGKRYHVDHVVEGWVGPRTDMDVVQIKNYFTLLARK